MRTQIVAISLIAMAPYNPRIITEEQMDRLKRSISEFNVYSPLIVNQRTNYVIGGNQRLAALKELGYQEVHVVYVDLADQQEKALNIALNKISGEWDEAKLAAILDELVKIPEFDEGLTGFDDTEISAILDIHLVPPDDTFDLERELKSIGEPVTKPGDIISLGDHRIICGDTTQEEVLKLLLGQEKVDLVHMDLPYGVSYDAKNRPGANKENISSQWKAIQNDDLKGEDHTRWFKQILAIIKPFLKDNASAYFWDGFVNFGPVTQVLTEEGFHVSNVITWVKPTACPSFADYWFKSEFILYCWLKSNTPHRWFGPKGESNVWFVDREPAGDYEHPTMKPTELARRVLKNSSIRGDIIFDGCMGAGFNLLACQQMGRMFRGVEIEPIYLDVAVRRFIRMFGPNSVSAEILKKYGNKLVVSELGEKYE